VAEAPQSEEFFGFRFSRQGDKEQRKVKSTCSILRCPTVGCHLFDANDVKARTHQIVRNVLSWSVVRMARNYNFDGVFELREKMK
jgi:hypothetical protein